MNGTRARLPRIPCVPESQKAIIVATGTPAVDLQRTIA